MRTVYSLETKATRQNWETIFNQYYIQPVLSTLTESLPNAIELVLNDEQQGKCVWMYCVSNTLKAKDTALCLMQILTNYFSWHMRN